MKRRRAGSLGALIPEDGAQGRRPAPWRAMEGRLIRCVAAVDGHGAILPVPIKRAIIPDLPRRALVTDCGPGRGVRSAQPEA